MEAEHHLPHGSAMRKDQCRPGLGASRRNEQLAVNLQAIFAFEDDLLRRD